MGEVPTELDKEMFGSDKRMSIFDIMKTEYVKLSPDLLKDTSMSELQVLCEMSRRADSQGLVNISEWDKKEILQELGFTSRRFNTALADLIFIGRIAGADGRYQVLTQLIGSCHE